MPPLKMGITTVFNPSVDQWCWCGRTTQGYGVRWRDCPAAILQRFLPTCLLTNYYVMVQSSSNLAVMSRRLPDTRADSSLPFRPLRTNLGLNIGQIRYHMASLWQGNLRQRPPETKRTGFLPCSSGGGAETVSKLCKVLRRYGSPAICSDRSKHGQAFEEDQPCQKSSRCLWLLAGTWS